MNEAATAFTFACKILISNLRGGDYEGDKVSGAGRSGGDACVNRNARSGASHFRENQVTGADKYRLQAGRSAVFDGGLGREADGLRR